VIATTDGHEALLMTLSIADWMPPSVHPALSPTVSSCGKQIAAAGKAKPDSASIATRRRRRKTRRVIEILLA